MDFNVDKILERRTSHVPVGDKTLCLRPLSGGHHTEFGRTLNGFENDVKALVEGIAPVIAPFLEGNGDLSIAALISLFTRHGPELTSLLLNTFWTRGGDILTAAAQIALDNEDNHDLLRKLFDEDSQKAKTEFGIYITSEPLRLWTKYNCTLAQAVHVVQEAISLTGYVEMGKAVGGFLAGAPTAPTAPEEIPSIPRTEKKNAKALP